MREIGLSAAKATGGAYSGKGPPNEGPADGPPCCGRPVSFFCCRYAAWQQSPRVKSRPPHRVQREVQ